MGEFYLWILDRWRRIGRTWRIALPAGFALLVVGSSVAGYRTWHYMQHDNRFCTSCHLMVDPYERFSRSAHAKRQCHDCHRATFGEQLHQLYATLVQRPTAITMHADVPNRVCGSCHVEGDPARWKIIANTAGHRIHLESKDSSLREIRCVTCHSVSVHEFASVDQTCGKTGCHTGAQIRLGPMGALAELHCTTCHNYLAEARTVAVDSLGEPLTPRARDCFSCHAMQRRLRNLDIGRDPHRGVCGNCHNPHRQLTPQDVTCTRSGCHAGWQTVSFHVGVPHPERCTTCHEPHSWRVEGRNCTRCHRNIPREPPTRPGRAPVRRTSLTVPDAVADLASASAALPVSLLRRTAQRAADRRTNRFSHGDHRGQRCSSCHSSRMRHGELVVRTAADCQRCHHVGPGREQCASCHAPADLRRPMAGQARTFRLAANRASVTREIAFEHASHPAVACAQCHTNPLSRAPEGADCASCHASHHRPASDCVTCHGAANALAAHRARDHPACASALCHGPRAAGLPSSRQACLMCHSAQQRHVPGRRCEECHRVTIPEAG